MKQNFDIIIATIIGIILISLPFVFSYLTNDRKNERMDKINEKYEQKLKEIKKCQSKECINEQMD